MFWLLAVPRQFEAMRRKIQRYESAQDMEDRASHMRAIAGCIHSIYSGMEKILKDLIRRSWERGRAEPTYCFFFDICLRVNTFSLRRPFSTSKMLV